MSRPWLQRLGILGLLFATSPHGATAQDKNWPDNVSDVILALPSQLNGGVRTYDNVHLFDGIVDARITAGVNDVDPTNFAGDDTITFRLTPRDATRMKTRPAGAGFDSYLTLTRSDFEEWAKRPENAKKILEVLFPSGLATAVSGRNTSTLFSQQLLTTTMLDVNTSEEQRRRPAAALFDTEWFTLDDPGVSNKTPWAMQGMYSFNPWMSVQARHSSLTRALSSSATSVAFDVHPFIVRGDYRDGVMLRVGGMGRGGFMWSSTKPVTGSLTAATSIPLPVFDYAGGGWAAVMHQFGPVLVGGASLFQATKHHALEGDGDNFRKAFAAAINERGVEYDLTLGGTAKAPITKKTSVIGSYAGTFGLNSVIDESASHAILGAVTYELAPGVTLNGGYKTTSLTGGRANSIFFQGNFGW